MLVPKTWPHLLTPCLLLHHADEDAYAHLAQLLCGAAYRLLRSACALTLTRAPAMDSCRYYGVPSLSWRDAAYHLMATNASGFTFDEVYLDHGHPNGVCGHR